MAEESADRLYHQAAYNHNITPEFYTIEEG